jgi:hypothetical protein
MARFQFAIRCCLCAATLVLASQPGHHAVAQQPGPARAPAMRTAGAVARAGAPSAKHRQLAPGAIKAIDPERQVAESVTRHDMVEVLASDPSYAERDWSKDKSPAKDTVFRRDVWSLEFAFKPVRFVHVDVPTPDGRLTPKLVWYLVYSVKNTGDKPVPFVPRFVLASRDTGNKVYPDRLIPLAVPLIRKREDPSRPLRNTVEITGKIPPTPKGQDANIWGVATWEDIDPRTDYFSIYVQGLTNAYLWKDLPGVFKKGDAPGTGRELYAKTLILNFWRPSDKDEEHEDEIRYENYSWQYGQLTPQGFVAKKPDPVQPAPQAVEQTAQEQ